MDGRFRFQKLGGSVGVSQPPTWWSNPDSVETELAGRGMSSGIEIDELCEALNGFLYQKYEVFFRIMAPQCWQAT